MTAALWVNRNNLTDFKLHEDAPEPLDEGQVRLKVESFSVTANNVTYAVAGDSFKYWDFFPAGEGYGIVPMWGHAVVAESRHPDISVGERIYGYLPMGHQFDMQPENISAGSFVDASAHRQPMSPIYNTYNRLASDPEHDPAKENERMLFAPLFKTGFLIADFFRRKSWFGAQALIMTSASSKTAMGLASCAKNMASDIRRIGLTSAANLEFTKSTGLYDEVLSYDDIGNIGDMAAVAVDFAGNAALLKNLHAQLGEQLKYSCLVGATHVDGRSGGLDGITGPRPVLFFAPDHAVAALKEYGPKAFGEAIATEWKSFLTNVDGTLTIDVRDGLQSAADGFTSIFRNEADPSVGIIIHP